MTKVCLLLEGTYPYVTGGVSSFIHQLISNTPDISYTIVYIGPNQNAFHEMKYPIPKNVEHIRELFLFDYDLEYSPTRIKSSIDLSKISKFHQAIKTNNNSQIYQNFEYLYHNLFNSDTRLIDPMQLFFDENSWEILQTFYQSNHINKSPPPFIDYFYTWRFSHYPVFKILMSDLPKADIYHAMSTGYAGLLGAIGVLKYKRPFLLTEHGIYSHEREIEISQSSWITNYNNEIFVTKDEMNFKNWWSQLFHFMSKTAYHYASAITTLYRGNQQKQIRFGAPPEKTNIIPNGIKIENYLLERKVDSTKFTIALVGRVVPIKDVKTFIKGIYIAKKEIPNILAYIIGPTDEDENYYEECLTLTNLFNLKDNIIFTGKARVHDYYPILDVLVLSSISEGQPLVILEAFCNSIPVLATDVGACSEMIYGHNTIDQQIGPAGMIIPFGQADQLAQALVNLNSDRDTLKQLGENGLKRVKCFYQEDQMISKYVNFYNQLTE